MMTPLFLNLIFTYFPVMKNSGKLKEISSASFYCIINPEVLCLQSVSQFHHGSAIFKLFYKIIFYILKKVNLWDFSHLPNALHTNLGVVEIALTIEKGILLHAFNQFEFTNHSSLASSLWKWETRIFYCTNLLAILSDSWVFCLLKLIGVVWQMEFQ